MTEKQLDARGLICPLPVLKARKVLLGMQPGEILRVQVTDKAAPEDFKLFCAEAGHQLKQVQSTDINTEIVVVCGQKKISHG